MSDPAPHTAAPAPETPVVTWADPGRQAAFERWLEPVARAHGLAVQTLRPASADASFRRYLRIDVAGGGSRIIMDAPPDKEDCRPFVKVAGLMADAGLYVPGILAWDEPQGFMLLDDVGRQTMMDVIDRDNPGANQALYLRAVDALVAWQLASRPAVLPAYDQALLARELQLFPDWYLARHRGVAVEGAMRDTLEAQFRLIIERNLAAPSLDFQDAVYGPLSYDIASLMRDAFISWDEEFVIDITVRYWQQARQAGLPLSDDFGEFYEAVEWMGLQRHLKILGIFARLTLRDGKPQYLADTPRFIGYVRQTASRYRPLAPLLRLIEQVEGGSVRAGYTF